MGNKGEEWTTKQGAQLKMIISKLKDALVLKVQSHQYLPISNCWDWASHNSFKILNLVPVYIVYNCT